jgi:hypothetical protein
MREPAQRCDRTGRATPAVARVATRSLAVVALSGAWLPIAFSSAVLLPQRVEQLVAGPRWSATYAALSAAGWLTVVIGLTLSGHLRDAGRLRSARDARTIRLLALAVLVTGAVLPLADDVATLAILWILALVPASLSVTLLASRVADAGAHANVGSASAIGSAPLLAVFIGALTVTLVPVAGAARFALVAAVAAAAIAGATIWPHTTAPHKDAPHEDAPRLAVVTDPAVRDAIGRNRRLLAAVTLVDTGTVTIAFAIVPLVFFLPRTGGLVATGLAPGAYAEQLVRVATVVSILAVWLAPRIAGVGARPRRLFAISALMTAAALATAPVADARMLLAVAVLAGLAIGTSNAATFGLFLGDPASTTQRATGLGLLNAVPSIPAALVPMLAVPLLRWSPEQGLVLLMAAAALLAAAGAIAAPPSPGTVVSGRRATRCGRGGRTARR